MIATSEQIAITLRQVFVPAGWNLRTDDPEVEALAQNLKLRGQLEPVVVRTGGPSPEQPYIATAGFRRLAAFRLNRWHDRELLAVVRTYQEEDDVLGPIADNWAENIARKDISTMDKALRVHQLVTGTYPVPEGREAVKLSAGEVSELLGLSPREVQKLARVARKLGGTVAEAAQKHAAPAWLVMAMSQAEGLGDSAEEKDASRSNAQMRMLDDWRHEKDALEAQGRKRAERSDKDKPRASKSAKAAPAALVADAAVGKREKGRTTADLRACLEHFHAHKYTGPDGQRIAAALETVKYLAGEKQSLTFLSETDWKDFEKARAVAADDVAES